MGAKPIARLYSMANAFGFIAPAVPSSSRDRT